MAKVLNIVEAKMMERGGRKVERVIFSDDKIVYVDAETGEVEPRNVSDKYADLISAFNATHIISGDGAKVNSQNESSRGDDRSKEIIAATDKMTLSNNPTTQSAINSVRSLGAWMVASGALNIVAAIIYLGMVAATYGFSMIGFVLLLPIGILQTVFGTKSYKLESTPSGIRGTAIFAILLGGSGLITRIGTLVYGIIVLTKVGHYENWYYKRVD